MSFPTKEGWLYLSVVINLYSRAVLGYQTSGAMPASIVTEALQKAHDFNQSMSGKSNCYDNTIYESFFSTLKREMLPDCGYFETREEAKSHIFEHIEGLYNTRRKHSSLGYQSPLEFIKENNQLELTT